MNRLSLNQWTTRRWSVAEAVDGCVRHGIPAIGLWRDHVAEHGLDGDRLARTRRGPARLIACAAAGSSPRGPGARTTSGRSTRRPSLGAACLVLVPGGLPTAPGTWPAHAPRCPTRSPSLAPYARERGVRLALEPMHPMYCADRS